MTVYYHTMGSDKISAATSTGKTETTVSRRSVIPAASGPETNIKRSLTIRQQPFLWSGTINTVCAQCGLGIG